MLYCFSEQDVINKFPTEKLLPTIRNIIVLKECYEITPDFKKCSENSNTKPDFHKYICEKILYTPEFTPFSRDSVTLISILIETYRNSHAKVIFSDIISGLLSDLIKKNNINKTELNKISEETRFLLNKNKNLIYEILLDLSIEDIEYLNEIKSRKYWSADNVYYNLEIAWPWPTKELNYNKDSYKKIIENYISRAQFIFNSNSEFSCLNHGQANWAENNYVNINNNPIFKNPDLCIPVLRWFSNMFSGYSPITWISGPSPTYPIVKDNAIFLSGHYGGIDGYEITHESEKLKNSLLRRAPSEIRYYYGYNYFSFKVPPILRRGLPQILGESGFYNNRDCNEIVNFESYNFIKIIAMMNDCNLIELINYRLSRNNKSFRIIEIGGGFGGLAYLIKKAYPEIDYIIVDLPESLVFSNIYLREALGDELVTSVVNVKIRQIEEKISFLTPPEFVNFADELTGTVDLFINTFSFAEMSAEQVLAYSKLISKIISNKGLLFEINNLNAHCNHAISHENLKLYLKHQAVLNSDFQYFDRAIGNIWANDPSLLNLFSGNVEKKINL